MVLLTLAPEAHGIPFLKATLEDIASLGEAEESGLLQPTKLIGAERHSIDYSYEHQNTISGSNLVLNNADSQFSLVFPLEKQLIGEKDALGIFVCGNNSQFQADNDLGGFDSSGQSDIVRFLYGVRLTDYLKVGAGVSQYRNPELNLDRGLGHNYEIRLSPSEAFEIGYGSERLRTANLTRIDYDGSWCEYPSFGISSKQRVDLSAWFGSRLNLRVRHEQEKIEPYQTELYSQGEIYDLGRTSEINTTYSFNQNVKFSGKVGTRNIGQDMRFYEGDHKFAFILSERESLFGRLGLAWRLQYMDLSFDLSSSSMDLSSRGGYLSENLPDMISNVDNIDKTADAHAKISTKGCHFGLSRPLSDRLAFKGKLSYLSMLLEGDANVWNSWFFGMIRQLEENYVTPIKRADLLVGKVGLRYLIHDELEANYAITQLIPLSVEESGQSSEDGDEGIAISGGETSSGGTTQVFSLTCYF